MTELAINFAGATVDINSLATNNILLTGTGTLSANYTLSTTASPLLAGATITFYFKATVDRDSYQFNILGTNLTVAQLNRESTIVAVYNGVSWDLNITPNTQAEEWLVPSDFADNRNLEVVVIPVSFETGEQCFNRAFIPYGFDLTDAWFHVTKAIAGTDDGTILIKGDTGLLRTITVPASTGLNIAIRAVVDNLTQISPQSSLDCVTSKTTAGGKGLVSLVLQRYE